MIVALAILIVVGARLAFAGSATCQTMEQVASRILERYPDATMRPMEGDMRDRFAARTKHRHPNATIVWFSRPSDLTAFVVTFRRGCATSMKEFPRDMLDEMVLGSLV